MEQPGQPLPVSSTIRDRQNLLWFLLLGELAPTRIFQCLGQFCAACSAGNLRGTSLRQCLYSLNEFFHRPEDACPAESWHHALLTECEIDVTTTLDEFLHTNVAFL